jgi:hypothetical protein
MRYPIFKFDGYDVWIIESPAELALIETYAVGHGDGWLDSDGRVLAARAAGDIVVADSITDPDPELLRAMLMPVLQRQAMVWSPDAPLEVLVATAEVVFYYGRGGVPLSKVIPRLLQFLHLKRRLPR